MKRIIAFTLTALLICTTLCAEENLFSFSAGLSSGFPVYGKESVASTGTEIEKGNRVILGIMGAVNLNPLPQVSFFLGNDILWDLTWNSSEKSNLTHVSFPLGLKVYPGFGGLNFGLAYTLGFRSDNIKISGHGEYNDITSWGNGFKFIVEYNFAHEGSSRFLPRVSGNPASGWHPESPPGESS